MKTQISLTQSNFIKQCGHINPKLIKAVINQFGGWDSFKEQAEDVTRHGINGGFGGFIYYSETHTFTIKNRALIVALLEDMAQQLGEDVVCMVNNFGAFRGSMDSDDKKDLYRLLGGGKPNQGAITNVMAWFAAEEVCRAYSDILND